MYLRIAGILFPVLVVALIGTVAWGYQENEEKNAILIKAENSYQRAFHDLNHHIDGLQDELAKSLAVNSRKQLAPCLTNAWRLAYAAQSDVGQLPLTLMPFSKTEEFLASIADFSHRVAMRDLDKEPLTSEEWSQLRKLYQRSNEIQQELQKVQAKVIENNLRWMDVEQALASEDKASDNTIIDGFKTIDKRVEEYHMDWQVGTAGLNNNNHTRLHLKGPQISAEEAKKRALAFLGFRNAANVDVDRNGRGSQYSAYSVSVPMPNSDSRAYVDVSKQGGKVIWYLNDRDIKNPKLDLNEALQKASRFLQKHGFVSMEPAMTNQYDNLGVFTFVYRQGNVRIYPDEVTVKVALDNGEVIGFQSEQYHAHHKPRRLQQPKISEEQARQKVNPRLRIEENRLAVIENPLRQEVLCYEYVGTIGNNTYRIYVNAENGDEELVEKMKD
ncbi:germination protein YpeB [Bacillaceae bacterium]